MIRSSCDNFYVFTMAHTFFDLYTFPIIRYMLILKNCFRFICIILIIILCKILYAYFIPWSKFYNLREIKKIPLDRGGSGQDHIHLSQGHITKKWKIHFLFTLVPTHLFLNFSIFLNMFLKTIDYGYRMNAINNQNSRIIRGKMCKQENK